MVANAIVDRVPRDSPGVREVGFHVPETYNASEVLFHNLDAGRGGKVAVRSPLGDATYGELCATACRAGNALKRQGLPDFGRVLLVLDDTPVYPAAVFGAIRARYVPVLVNTSSTADLVGYYLADSDAEIAVVESGLCALFDAETIRGSKLRRLVVANGPPPAGLPVEAVAWDDWLAGADAELGAAPTHRDDMAFWMYSSGSTDRPKGIVHLQHDMAFTHRSYGERVLGIEETDICYSPPKIFFAYGFGNALTFPFSVGATSVLCPGRPTPEAVFDCIERYRPTLLFGLPTLYNALINHPRAATADLGSVKLCLSAAETLSADLFGAWAERFGLDIVEGLGSTELLHIYLSNTIGSKRLGSAGRRVPGYEIELVDAKGAPVAAGKPGVLRVRGASSAPCYWNQPAKTAETMRDGWIHTGDRFRVDGDGFHYFLGRTDDLIKVSGQWVYPLEVEHCLSEHPAVLECAVMGVERADRLMTLKAFVVVAAGHQAGDRLSRELKDYVKAELMAYKYPRTIEYLAALPKTGTGKIDRQKLLARINE